MSTTIPIYSSESQFRLVLLVRKSSRSDQIVNSQKKKKMTTLPQTRNLGIKVLTLPQTHDLVIRISDSEEAEHSNH